MTSSVLLIGKPNSGKSMLFNRLTGLRQKVANFPGVTVEIKSATVGDITYQDFPGIYSLNPVTRDEEIAVGRFNQALADHDLSGIVCILDATRLERSLMLGLQVRQTAMQSGKAVLFVVNMMDEVEKNGASVDTRRMEEALGCPVIPVSAKTGSGLANLSQAITLLTKERRPVTAVGLEAADFKQIKAGARSISTQCGPKADVILKGQNALDQVFLHSIGGGLLFVAIMLFLFQAIFTWAAPLMDFVESTIGSAGEAVSAALPPGVFADFMRDAVFGGFGSFLVFVPQIFMLTFIIGLLEDSGYLARAAVICHKPLSFFGLSGKSFVPLLSGHACAIPALFAARTIESPRRRLLTMLVIPLMSCSARLPVYALLIAALIPATTWFGGLIGLQGVTFFALFALGIVTAMVISGILSSTVMKKTGDAPFIIELPPYRMPGLKPLVLRSLDSAWAFITKAGFVIFVVTVVVWVLGYFPDGPEHLASSWLGSLGKFIEPVFAPLDLDWKYGVAILASFVAREVFVGTLGTLFGIEGADENIAGLADQIQASGLTLPSGIGLLVFYVIALQCASTLAVLRKETGSFKLPVGVFIFYSVLAYVMAVVAYQLVLLV
jgi:ferrous iron transport protein B